MPQSVSVRPEILVATPQGNDVTAILWRALAALSQEPRWLAWISPPQRPMPVTLQYHGLDLNRVLMVQTRIGQDPLQLAERALGSGLYSAVLTWSKTVDSYQWQRLQTAATVGNSLAMVFPG